MLTSKQVWKLRYALKGERKITDTFRRVAKVLSDNPHTEDLFYNVMKNLEFLPAGRVLANAGLPNAVLFNCAVIPLEDNMESIMRCATEMALLWKAGCGVGVNVSPLRPAGSKVKGARGTASGPVSFVDIFDAVAATIKQGGNRRAALTIVMNDNHPDLLDFIKAKANDNARWTNADISVAFTGDPRKCSQFYIDRIAETTAVWGEPGVLFLKNIQSQPGCENVTAVNPCVVKDTWVMTREGPRQVADLIGKPFVAVVNGREYPSTKDGFFFTGKKTVYRLTTEEGYHLVATGDHKVLVDGKKTYIKDLEKGDRVTINSAQASWSGSGYTWEEGFLIGLLLGDGTISSRNGKDRAILAIWGNSEGPRAVRDRASVCFQRFKTRSDFKGWHYREKETKYIATFTELTRLCHKLGIRHGNKAVTSEMEKASSDFYKGFLNGFFSTDGTVCSQGSKSNPEVSVRLTQTRLENLYAVQRMLLRLGIKSSIYTNRHKSGKRKMPDGKGGLKEYTCKAVHELSISKDNVILFRDVIGFTDTEKQAKLNAGISRYQRGPYKTTYTVRVKSVEHVADNHDVYNCTIQGVHLFDGNGFIVPQCGEAPLPPYQFCDLGSVNLKACWENSRTEHDFYERIYYAALIGFEMLDAVYDHTEFVLPAMRESSLKDRRLGLGMMGLADLFLLREVRYGSPEALSILDKVLQMMHKAAENWKVTQAHRGKRNVTLFSQAPTGSIAHLAGCSSGIEPIFHFVRKEKVGDTYEGYVHPIYDRYYRKRKPDWLITAEQVTVEEHLEIQTLVQRYFDQAISKTLWLPKSMSEEEAQEAAKKIIFDAYDRGLKGLTIWWEGGRRSGAIKKAFRCENCGAIVESIEGACQYCSECGFGHCE